MTVEVARLPRGKDPGELAGEDPAGLRAAVDEAEPFLGFRVGRVLRSGGRVVTPEAQAKLASTAMVVVNEHPDVNVRKLYAGQVAQHTGLPVADLVRVAEQRTRGRGACCAGASAFRERGVRRCWRSSSNDGTRWRRGWSSHCSRTSPTSVRSARRRGR